MSTKTKHTPGPWQIVKDLAFPIEKLFVSREGNTDAKIATLEHDADEGKRRARWETELANARLIAAAPELLEALIDARSMILRMKGEFSSFPQARFDAIEAAIAKAEGRA